MHIIPPKNILYKTLFNKKTGILEGALQDFDPKNQQESLRDPAQEQEILKEIEKLPSEPNHGVEVNKSQVHARYKHIVDLLPL